MKKNLTIALMLLGVIALAQEVPSSITNAFNTKFKNAGDLEWVMEDGSYVASFMQDEDIKFAAFDASGKWLYTKLELIMEGDLPVKIIEAYKKKFLTGNAYRYLQVTDASNVVVYEVELSTDNDSFLIIIDDNGKILSDTKISD